MVRTIESIWIESEDKGPIVGGRSMEDDNTDVIVTFSDATRYVATFFTYANVDTLTRKNRSTGENLAGTYFWASDMVLIDRLDRDSLTRVVQEMIKNGEFDRVFRSIGPWERPS